MTIPAPATPQPPSPTEIIEHAHQVLDDAEVIIPRDVSHLGLIGRIRAVLDVLAAAQRGEKEIAERCAAQISARCKIEEELERVRAKLSALSSPACDTETNPYRLAARVREAENRLNRVIGALSEPAREDTPTSSEVWSTIYRYRRIFRSTLAMAKCEEAAT